MTELPDRTSEGELLDASYAFLESIRLCFVCDVGFTENADFETVVAALMGKEVEHANQWNLADLAKTSQAFREQVACHMAVRIRHGHG